MTLDDILFLLARHNPGLASALRACFAVFGAMALAGRTKPLSLIFEIATECGKTPVLQMAFPLWGIAIPLAHRLMSQLGTRLLFLEVPAILPTADDLLANAQKVPADTAEKECQETQNKFLVGSGDVV